MSVEQLLCSESVTKCPTDNVGCVQVEVVAKLLCSYYYLLLVRSHT